MCFKLRENYLSDIYQRTKISKISISQGSVLGPLLFTIYINKVQYVLNNFSFSLCADYTLIYVFGSDMAEVIINVNNELDVFNRCLCFKD